MKRLLVVPLVLVLLAGLVATAGAQPGQQSVPPCNPCYLTPPPAVASPPPVLSREDWRLLERGEMNKGRYVVGGVLGSYVGFGFGHAVQGRWLERGWIFTLGDTASLTMALVGFTSSMNVVDCSTSETETRCGDSTTPWRLMLVGIGTYAGLRIWEIVDLWSTPARQRKRIRALRAQLGLPPGARVVPYVIPVTPSAGMGGAGATAGLSLQF